LPKSLQNMVHIFFFDRYFHYKVLQHFYFLCAIFALDASFSSLQNNFKGDVNMVSLLHVLPTLLRRN